MKPSSSFLGIFRAVLVAAMAGGLWGQGAPDALDQLNAAFRTTYVQAKAGQLAGTVIMVDGDRVLLRRRNATVAESTIRPFLYHRFKAVDHVPLALYLALTPVEKAPFSPGRLSSLKELHALLEAAQDGLRRDFPQGPALQRQQRILDRSERLLSEAVAQGRVSQGALDAFARDLTPLLMDNIKDAAALQLEALHRAVSLWRKGMAPAEWDGLRVVILGAHMARDGELSWQYFSRLLAQPGEGDRIIYAEGCRELGEALDLMATHGVDRGLGRAFFGDPARMHRDVLADAAKGWLEAHP